MEALGLDTTAPETRQITRSLEIGGRLVTPPRGRFFDQRLFYVCMARESAMINKLSLHPSGVFSFGTSVWEK